MKDYIKTLFPFRWIIITIFILCISLIILMAPSTGHFTYKSIWLILNPFFWLLTDFVVGIGQEDYWVRKENTNL